MSLPYRRRLVSIANRAYSSDPLEQVDAIGGTNSDHTHWTLSQTAAVAAIEAGTDEFFVNAGGQPVKLIVHSHEGEKYLRTEREHIRPGDLLNLAVR